MDSAGNGTGIGSGDGMMDVITDLIGHRELCSSGQFNLSCFDSTLDTNGITTIRWKSSTPDTATATAATLLVYMVLGVPCNLFVIATILYKKLYKEPLFILLLNLVINDLILCLTFIPMNIVSGFAGEFIFGSNDVMRCHICKSAVIISIFIDMALHLLALMTIDRFIYFQFPFQYPRIVTIKTTLLVVLLTWIFCVLICIPPLFKFGEIRFTHSLSTCFPYYLDRTDLTYNIFYEVFSLAEAFLLPIPILIFLNIGIVRLACKHIKEVYHFRGSVDNTQSSNGVKHVSRKSLKTRKQFKLVKVYSAILIFHVISWLPIVIVTAFIFVFCDKPFVIPHAFFVFNYAFSILGVVMHPILQAFLIPEIRSVLTECTCKTTIPRDMQEALPQSHGGIRMSILRSLSMKSDVVSNTGQEGRQLPSSCVCCCVCCPKWSSKITGGSQPTGPSHLTNGTLRSPLQSTSQLSPPSLHKPPPPSTATHGDSLQLGSIPNSTLSSHPLQSSCSSPQPHPSSNSSPVQNDAVSCSRSEGSA